MKATDTWMERIFEVFSRTARSICFYGLGHCHAYRVKPPSPTMSQARVLVDADY